MPASSLLSSPAYPTSYFVDSAGRVVTSPEIGANEDDYASRIEEALKDSHAFGKRRSVG